ncbi:hypothetical protein K435DRAFT_925277 [Dendrothele bispora CBS 962.96]|uniref:Uncharacterized protein n=1 Tax=Dendrothele bispora (strain CBS 962.96) TaxID=1314807 RepID=A0A4S8MH73_DENBC|nr:hypothetical protein K435DRAFT_925277 [Dendrothele bispora CBS 962.96]
MSRSSSSTEDTPPSYTASRPSDTSPIATSSGIQLRRDTDLLIRHFLPPSPPDRTLGQDEQHRLDDHGEWTNQETNALPLPVCIPQSTESIILGPGEPSVSFGIGEKWTLPLGHDRFSQYRHHRRNWYKSRCPLQIQTDRYFRTANLNLFHPRGLSVHLCTTSTTLMLIQSSDSNSGDKKKGTTKANEISRGVGSALLNSPIPILLAGPIVRALADKPVPIPPAESPEGGVLRRRLTVVQEPGLALSL